MVTTAVVFGAFVMFRNPMKNGQLSFNDIYTVLAALFVNGWWIFALSRYLFNKCHLDNEEA